MDLWTLSGHQATGAGPAPSRLDRIRSELKAAECDALVAFGSLHAAHLAGYDRYLSDLADLVAVVVTADGNRMLVCGRLEVAAAEEDSDVDDIRGFGRDDLLTLDSTPALAAACREIVGAGRLAVAGRPALVELLGGVTEPFDEVLERIRRVKDLDEIVRVAAATKLAFLAQGVVERSATDGQSEIALFSAARAAAEAAAGRPVGWVCTVAAGEHSALISPPFCVPGADPVSAGAPLLCDISVRHRGYWGDTTRTYGGDTEVGSVRDTLTGVLDEMADAASPGLPASVLYAVGRDAIASRIRRRDRAASPWRPQPRGRDRRAAADPPGGLDPTGRGHGLGARAGRILRRPLRRADREHLRRDSRRRQTRRGGRCVSPGFQTIVPIVTPYGDDGAVSTEAIAAHASVLAAGRHGRLLRLRHQRRGATALGDDEVVAATRAVAGAAPGRRIIPQVGRPSTRASRELLERCVEAGATAVAVITPYFYRVTDDGEREHYRQMIHAADRIPVLAYVIPTTRATTSPPSLVAELAAAGLAGVKDSTKSRERHEAYVAVREVAGRPEFETFVGEDSLSLEAFRMGSSGAVPALANFRPELFAELIAAMTAGRRRAGGRASDPDHRDAHGDSWYRHRDASSATWSRCCVNGESPITTTAYVPRCGSAHGNC